MLKSKWSRFKEFCCRRPGLVLLILPCILILTLYFISGNDIDNFQYLSFKSYNDSDIVDGYLVWNPKCHMLSKSPLDPSIVKFVKKEKFQVCSKSPLLTTITHDNNGSSILIINEKEAKHYKGLSCCWAPIIRPAPQKPNPQEKFDSSVKIEHCVDFFNSVTLPKEVELLMVSCKENKGAKSTKEKSKAKYKKPKKAVSVYDNVHPVLNPERVLDRLNISETGNTTIGRQRKLSVLLLGLDNVSRLNLQRTLPRTENHLRKKGWLSMKGYNKMGENTFPNLMALLTGQNQADSYIRCKPTVPFGLDLCPIIWYNFRNAGFVTAYAEDEAKISTFNYLKVGFVDPPTDYYLRPYMIASEKVLNIRTRFGDKYCTGPEVTVDRILDYAIEFAKTFLGVPYFGFFWMNSISHDTINGLSSMDAHILTKLERLEKEGVMNDSMVIFLSDHGMRYGDIRNTFIGWYEERLPFIYIWLPEWFREEDPEAYQALTVNQNRLTSPYDLYETLRDILIRAGGEAISSSGCPKCASLFKTVPMERGCEDAGVASHWCVCTAFKKEDARNKIVVAGAQKIVDHIENIVKNYKNKKGKRLCSKQKVKKIHRVHRVLDLVGNSTSVTEYFYMIQVTPGDGRFEATVRYHGSGNYSISDEEVSRINSYAYSAKCLDFGQKRYCHCVK